MLSFPPEKNTQAMGISSILHYYISLAVIGQFSGPYSPARPVKI